MLCRGDARPLGAALSTSILLDEQLHCRYMTVILVSGSYRQCLCETASRLSVATSTHMLKGLATMGSNIISISLAITRTVKIVTKLLRFILIKIEVHEYPLSVGSAMRRKG